MIALTSYSSLNIVKIRIAAKVPIILVGFLGLNGMQVRIEMMRK